MMRQLKAFTVNLVSGANLGTVALLLLAAYSDRVSPADVPVAAWAGMTLPLLLLLNMGFLAFWLVFKWRRAWIPILGMALAYVPIKTYIPLNSRQKTPMGALKVLSYNVCTYGGNYKYDNGFDTIYNYLKRQQADIVCLQEDVDSWRRYVMLRYQKIYPYNDTTIFCNTRHSMNGVGIHTRFPILRKERIWYTSKANGSVAYYLLVEGDTVLVVNNHLEGTHLSTEDRTRYKEMLKGKMERDTAQAESRMLMSKLSKAAATRAPQAEAVRRYISEHSQYPVIVCGDLNDTPISYTRRTLSRGLTDCFVETGRGLGLSYNQKGFFFRIDDILCSSDFEPFNCQVDNKMDASDHYPMLCWLKKRNKR